MGKARRKDVKEAEARLKRKEEQKKRKLISREVNLERASAKREQNRQILVVTEVLIQKRHILNISKYLVLQ